MVSTVEVVEFMLGGECYALDIHLVREIVEMLQITPIPRAPPYISGVINLRGEITNIMNLNNMLGLVNQEQRDNQKIIVLVPEVVSGSNVGIIVDDVIGVLQIAEADVERLGEGLASEVSGFVKGIIKLKNDEADKKSTRLIIWIDMQKVIEEVAKK
ncbi:MAG: chemotaxis protein CheW [Methanoregula sp.]|jgi:purine-binding chemotaxis protein CheW|nr:chemotaxis protein CheW [Methanoregula sp.]